jgi:hypothetical protein
MGEEAPGPPMNTGRGLRAPRGTKRGGPLRPAVRHLWAPVLIAGVATGCQWLSENRLPPTLTLTADPLSIAAGETSTLTWASINTTTCAASGGWSGDLATAGSQGVSPASTTTYALACSGAGGSASESTTVTVVPAPTVTLTAIPASIASGQSSTLTWSSTDATSCAASGGWSGLKATSGSEDVSPSSTTIYRLACTGPGGNASDSATVTVTATPAPPTVSLTANPESIATGQASTLTWSSTNATSCTASGGWTGTRATSGSLSVSPASTTKYRLACTGTGGTTSDSATVTVTATPAPPTVTLTASPTSIASGQSSTLDWSSTNATSCTASGGWTGTKATSGSESVSPTSTTKYRLACTGTGGTSSDSATVTVVPAPTVTLTANPTSITAGQSSMLTWSSTNATSCTASGGWTGTKATSGSQSVSPASTTTYTLACTGIGGTTSQSATVTVSGSPPGVYAYPLSVDASGRHLVDQNGQPFLLVGDAAWSLIAQLQDTAADSYLANRQQLGFDAVLVNLIEHYFADHAPNDIYNIAPFTGRVFTTPNPAYFAHADYIIQSAAQKGILVLLAPVYTGFDCGNQGWAAEMESASDADMTAWGQYLGQHYASFDNILWVIGGDADPRACSPSVKGKLQDVVNGIQQYDTRHPFTAHNVRGMMGITPWTGSSWLNVNTTYTSGNDYAQAQTAYAVTPALPFFLIESIYEGEGGNSQELRAQSYWTILAGGIGHVFGNCPIWGFGTVSCGGSNWRAALNLQGSVNMSHVQKLFTGRHWGSLVPDLSHTVVTSSSGAGTVTAACAADSSSIIAYLPARGSVTVSGACLRDAMMNVYWVNPQNGAATPGGAISSRSPQSLTPPTGGAGDWVLIADSPSFGFGQPGG